MVGRRELGSWLDRSLGVAGTASDDAGYPGQRLGRPETGSRSVARLGRRVLGLLLDWAIALVISAALLSRLPLGSFGALIVFGVENALLVATAGGTIGHRAAGLRVERLDGGPPRPWQALARSVLICLVLPPLVWDRDGRGMHDRLAGTVVTLR